MDFNTRMYRIRKTCLEMLHDRGYLITEVGGLEALRRGAGARQGATDAAAALALRALLPPVLRWRCC